MFRENKKNKNIYLFDVGIRQIILPLILKSGNKSFFKYYMSVERGALVSVMLVGFSLVDFSIAQAQELELAEKNHICFRFFHVSLFERVRNMHLIDNTAELHIRIGRCCRRPRRVEVSALNRKIKNKANDIWCIAISYAFGFT